MEVRKENEDNFTIKNWFSPTKLLDSEINITEVDFFMDTSIDVESIFENLSINNRFVKENQTILITNQKTQVSLSINVNPDTFFDVNYTVISSTSTNITYEYFSEENGVYTYQNNRLVRQSFDYKNNIFFIKTTQQTFTVRQRLDGFWSIEGEPLEFIENNIDFLRHSFEYQNLFDSKINGSFLDKDRIIFFGNFGLIMFYQDDNLIIINNPYKFDILDAKKVRNNYLFVGTNSKAIYLNPITFEFTQFRIGDYYDVNSFDVYSNNSIYVGQYGTVITSDDFRQYNHLKLTDSDLNIIKYKSPKKGYVAGDNGELFSFDKFNFTSKKISNFKENITDIHFRKDVISSYLNFNTTSLSINNTLTKQDEFSLDIHFRADSDGQLFQTDGLTIRTEIISGELKIIVQVESNDIILDRILISGEFYNLTISREKENYNFYINGAIDTKTIGYSGSFTGDDIIIGQSFNGIIAHIRFYDKALTENSILNNYRNYITDIKNLTAWYNFEEIDGTIDLFDKKNKNMILDLQTPTFEEIITLTDVFVGENKIVFYPFIFEFDFNIKKIEFLDDFLFISGENSYIVDLNNLRVDILNDNVNYEVSYTKVLESGYNSLKQDKGKLYLINSETNAIDWIDISELCEKELVLGNGINVGDISFVKSIENVVQSLVISPNISPLTQVYVSFVVEKLHNGILQIQSANEWINITQPGKYLKKISVGSNSRIRFRVVEPVGNTITSEISNVIVYPDFSYTPTCELDKKNINFDLYGNYDSKLLFLDYDIANKLYFFNQEEYQLPNNIELNNPLELNFSGINKSWIELDREVREEESEKYNTSFVFDSENTHIIENFDLDGIYMHIPETEVTLNVGDVVYISSDVVKHTCFVESINNNNEYIIKTRFNSSINNSIEKKGEFTLIELGKYSSFSNLEENFKNHFLGRGYTLEKNIISNWEFDFSGDILDMIEIDKGVYIVGDFGVKRFSVDGRLDQRFSSSLVNLKTISVQADGKIIVGGDVLHRLNRDGSLDFDYNISNVKDSIVLPDGKIIVATDTGLFKFRESGIADNSFSDNINTSVLSISLTGGGNIYVSTINEIFRINQNGDIDTTINITGGPYGKLKVFGTRLFVIEDGELKQLTLNGVELSNYGQVNDFDIIQNTVITTTNNGAFMYDFSGPSGVLNFKTQSEEYNFSRFISNGVFIDDKRYYQNGEEYTGNIDIQVSALFNNSTAYKNMEFKVNNIHGVYPNKFLDFKYNPFYNILDIIDLNPNFTLSSLPTYTFANNNQNVVYNLTDGEISFNSNLKNQYDEYKIGTFVDLINSSTTIEQVLLYRKSERDGRFILHILLKQENTPTGNLTIRTRNTLGEIASDLNLFNTLDIDMIQHKPNSSAYLNALLNEDEILSDLTGVVYRDEHNNLAVNFINLPITNQKNISEIGFYRTLNEYCEYNPYQLFNGNNQKFIINNISGEAQANNINNQILITSAQTTGTLEVDLDYQSNGNKILSFDVEFLESVDGRIEIDGILLATIPNNINRSYNIKFDSDLSGLKFIFDYTEDSLVDIKNIRIGNLDCKYFDRKLKVCLDDVDDLSDHIILKIENDIFKEDTIFSSEFSWNELNSSPDLFDTSGNSYSITADGVTGSINLSGGIINESINLTQGQNLTWNIGELNLNQNPHLLKIRYKSNNPIELRLVDINDPTNFIELTGLDETGGEYFSYQTRIVPISNTSEFIFNFKDVNYIVEILSIEFFELINTGNIYDGLHTIDKVEGNCLYLNTDYIGGIDKQTTQETTINVCGKEIEIDVLIPVSGLAYIWEFDPMLKYQPLDIIPINSDKTINNSIKIEMSDYEVNINQTNILELDRNKFRFSLTDGLSIRDIDENYPWLFEAELTDGVVGIKDGILTLYKGIWECGRWFSGDILSAMWKDGQFYGGRFLNHLVEKDGMQYTTKQIDSHERYSLWHGGDFRSGLFSGGAFNGGNFYGDRFENSTFLKGTFHNGNFLNSNFNSGVFVDGVVRNSIFKPILGDVLFLDGEVYDSEFSGEIFTGFVSNSILRDTNWHNGDIRDSEFHHGRFETGNAIRTKFIDGNIWHLNGNDCEFLNTTFNPIDVVGYVVDQLERNYLITIKGEYNFKVNNRITIQGRDDKLFGATVSDNYNIVVGGDTYNIAQRPRVYTINNNPIVFEKDNEKYTRLSLASLSDYFIPIIDNTIFFANGYIDNEQPTDKTISGNKLNSLVSNIRESEIINSIVYDGLFVNTNVHQITTLDGHFSSSLLVGII